MHEMAGAHTAKEGERQMDILIYLVIGILLGLFVLPSKVKKANGALQQVSMVAALFFMGVSLGMQPNLVQDLREAGIVAFFISIATIAGSVLLTWLVSSLALRRRGGGKK